MPKAATRQAKTKTETQTQTRTAAERMQISRDRRRIGILPVRMLLGPAHLDGLRNAGFLDDEEPTTTDTVLAVMRLLVALGRSDGRMRIGDLAGG